MDLKTLQTLQSEVENLLEMIEVDYVAPVLEVDEDEILKVELTPTTNTDISSLGVLIGPHGETLAAIEYVLALMINQGREEWLRVQLDVDGYRKKRFEELKELVRRTAEKVRYLKEEVALKPMPSYERRMVHTLLSSMEGIVSESTGEGKQRRVVVKPK